MKKVFILLFATLFLQVNSANSATSSWQENQSKGAKTKLIASFYQNSNGEKKLIAGVHFKIAKGWKIYGHGSESIGLPPSLDFSGSKNVVNTKISWPQPIAEEEKIGKETIQFFSYKDEVILPIEIDLADTEQETELSTKLSYGLCKDVCIPASETFLLQISNQIDEEVLHEIQKFYPQKISVNYQKKPPENSENFAKKNYLLTLISAVLLALFGGLILNIMPCVLPVLSIKLISVIKHSNSTISRIRFAFIATITGILFCFVIFGFLASLIKFTGNSFGWGLQFQNPYFLIFLILILVGFIANLLGIFEVNFSQFLATILNKKISQGEERHNIFVPNFFSGVLAVLLATPCSAPFLGAAISFALAQSFSVIFLIFLSIGVGFALPYFALLIAPKLVYLLPKPGNWMFKAKQLMAGLLAATVIWLIYILSHNIGSLLAFLIGALAIALLACIKIKSDLLRYLAIAATIISAFSLPVDSKETPRTKPVYDMIWQKFDESEIYRQVQQGKVVVVDITADWCLTCKFNKVRVLQDAEVVAKLKGDNIVNMRGDITKPDEEIVKFLHKNNRFAIPFNAVYGPNAKKGLLASELLNKKELLELIEEAK